MRRLALLGALVLAAQPALASTVLHLSGSDSLAALAAPAPPLALSRAAGGTATIGANATSSTDSVSGGVGVATTLNSTAVRNNAATDVQVRLVYRTQTGGAASQCARCDLQIKNGTATTTEITETGVAPASGTAGPWVTLKSGQSCWVLALAQANIVADTQVNVLYALELQPLPATGSPIDVKYVDMEMRYTV